MNEVDEVTRKDDADRPEANRRGPAEVGSGHRDLSAPGGRPLAGTTEVTWGETKV